MNYSRQRLMASGGSLAVDTGFGHVALLQGFSIEGFQMTYNHVELWEPEASSWPRLLPTRQQVELSIVSRGPVHFLDSSKADHLFLDPINASIDELLELAYRKMTARSQHKNPS